MSQLDSTKRAKLPDSAFAYVDSKGRRRLPINDESHVRNALARFNQVVFEDEAARERARKKLLVAARKYGIVPIGFMTGQLESRTGEATAGRLVVELGQVGTPAEFERRLRAALRDPTLTVLHWSDSAGGYLDRDGQPAALPATGAARERSGDDPARAPGSADDGAGAFGRRAEDSGPPEDGDRGGQVGGGERSAPGAGPGAGQRVANAADGQRHVPADRHRGSTGLLHRLGDRYAALLGRRPCGDPRQRASRAAAARSTRAPTSSSPCSSVPRRARSRARDRARPALSRLARRRRRQGPGRHPQRPADADRRGLRRPRGAHRGPDLLGGTRRPDPALGRCARCARPIAAARTCVCAGSARTASTACARRCRSSRSGSGSAGAVSAAAHARRAGRRARHPAPHSSRRSACRRARRCTACIARNNPVEIAIMIVATAVSAGVMLSRSPENISRGNVR